MLGSVGRYEGEIREFKLWNPKSQRYFVAVCEWIDGEWISQCSACRKLRVLKVNAVTKNWECQNCGRKGRPKEERKKKEKKREKPT